MSSYFNILRKVKSASTYINDISSKFALYQAIRDAAENVTYATFNRTSTTRLVLREQGNPLSVPTGPTAPPPKIPLEPDFQTLVLWLNFDQGLNDRSGFGHNANEQFLNSQPKFANGKTSALGMALNLNSTPTANFDKIIVPFTENLKIVMGRSQFAVRCQIFPTTLSSTVAAVAGMPAPTLALVESLPQAPADQIQALPGPIGGVTLVGSVRTDFDFWGRYETNYNSNGSGPSLRWDNTFCRRDMIAGFEFQVGPQHGTHNPDSDSVGIKLPRCVSAGGERGDYIAGVTWYANGNNSTGFVGKELPHPTGSHNDFNVDDPNPTIGNAKNGVWHGVAAILFNNAQNNPEIRVYYNQNATGLASDYVYLGRSIDTGNISSGQRSTAMRFESCDNSGGAHGVQIRIDEIPREVCHMRNPFVQEIVPLGTSVPPSPPPPGPPPSVPPPPSGPPPAPPPPALPPAPTSFRYLWQKRDDAANGAIAALGNDGTVHIYVQSAGNWIKVQTGANAVVVNQWHDIWFYINGTEPRIWVNTVYNTVSTPVNLQASLHGDFIIGAYNYGNVNGCFRGLIDDLRVYVNRAIIQTNINNLATNGVTIIDIGDPSTAFIVNRFMLPSTYVSDGSFDSNDFDSNDFET